MRVQNCSRSLSFTALAISLIALAGFPQVAGAVGQPPDKGKSNAPGQERKAEPDPDPQPQTSDTPSNGTPTAADSPEGFSNHDAANGPGGQVCDGDPSAKSDTGNGANGGGDNYNDTCAGGVEPSQNGAGDGEATGKPCAGCVGNADDKNPPGQFPSGPGDANNGYECDQKGRSTNEGNNGIGFGNPAHTGCADSLPPPPPPPVETCPNGDPLPAGGSKNCGPRCPNGSALPANGGLCTEPCVSTAGAVCAQATPTCVEAASEARCGGAAAVLSETFARPVDPGRLEVLGVVQSAPAALGRTGLPLAPLGVVGLALAAFGLVLTALSRFGNRKAFVDVASDLTA